MLNDMEDMGYIVQEKEAEYYQKSLVQVDKKSIINQKIKELKKLAKLDKDIATLKAKIIKLENEKRELEKKYDI
jgi:hypothetical protein